jgi:hypothetical protein
MISSTASRIATRNGARLPLAPAISTRKEYSASVAGRLGATHVISVVVASSTSRYDYVRVTTASDVTGGLGVTAWTVPVWTGR